MIDNKTQRLSLPLPNVDNYLEDDVGRLADALSILDEKVATVGDDGKITLDQLPAIAITDTFPVNNADEMLALNAQKGDVAIRSDVSKSFILMAEPASTLANWKEFVNDALAQLAKPDGIALIGGLGTTIIRIYPTVAAVQADTSIKVGDTVRVSTYWAGVPGGAGEWVKTAEVVTPNKGPANLERMAFSDALGNVFTFSYDAVRGVDIEQLGGKPYSSASPDLTVDLSGLLLALYRYQLTRGANTLKVNFKAREYYSSKGIPLAPWSDYRSTGRLSTQFYIDPGLWTDAELPPTSMSGVNTFYSLKSFHAAVIHPANTHASNIDLHGFDFTTRAGFHVDYGLYLPYVTEFKFANLRHAGEDTGIYWRNIYSGVFDRCVFTARTNTPTKAGSWGMYSQERSAGSGCGTSVLFINCNFTDFILGFDVTGMTYTTSINHITEGTQTQIAGTLRNCDWTFTQWGVERLTSTRTESLVRIIGGNVTINGVILAYNVTANNTAFIEVTSGARANLFGVNGKLSTGIKSDSFIVTTDDCEVLIGPVIYPATGSYTNKLGAKTTMIGTGGNLNAHPDIANAAALSAVGNAINTVGKYMGRAVYASSLGTMVYASGSTPTDVWRNGVGTVVYTPA